MQVEALDRQGLALVAALGANALPAMDEMRVAFDDALLSEPDTRVDQLRREAGGGRRAG